MEKTLYTITVFSENNVGLLNQVTIVFTRRSMNIETLSVSPSAIPGIHKFTITCFSDRESMIKVVKQIDKRVDVIKAYFNTDDELVHQEIALYKISSRKILERGVFEDVIRKYRLHVLELNEHYVVFQKIGHYAETQQTFDELHADIGVLQFIRSGRVAITKSKVERLTDMLEYMEDVRKRQAAAEK